MSKKHNHSEEEHADETWLIPYSDLLTLLLALFIVLFASSQIDQKKFDMISQSLSAAFTGGSGMMSPSAVVPITEDPGNRTNKELEDLKKVEETDAYKFQQETIELKELQQKLDEYIKDSGLTTQLETNLNNSQLMITISDNALFPSGSAEIKPEAHKLATAIADMLSQYPGYDINVAGHTDNVPIHTVEFNSNYELSYKRALNFMLILLANPGLDPEVFTTIGYGEYRPIDTNSTAIGRSKNRRVEVSIIRHYQSSAEETQTISAE